MFSLILLLHILGTTIWTGGHLILATVTSVLFVVVGVSFRYHGEKDRE